MKYNHATGMFYKSDETPDIIGQTQSGKQVLGGNAEAYSGDFNSEDHLDAKEIHTKKLAKLQTRSRMSMLQSKTFNHKLLSSLSNQAAHHAEQSEYHNEQAEQETPSEDMGKSLILSNDVIDFLDASQDLNKGRGPDKQQRKHRGALPGADANITGDSRFRGYSDKVLGQDKNTAATKQDVNKPPNRTLEVHEIPKAHYSKPNNQKYRDIIAHLGDKAHGAITYHHQTDTIHTLGSNGNKLISKLTKDMPANV